MRNLGQPKNPGFFFVQSNAKKRAEKMEKRETKTYPEDPGELYICLHLVDF